jgi:hypothetical protein
MDAPSWRRCNSQSTHQFRRDVLVCSMRIETPRIAARFAHATAPDSRLPDPRTVGTIIIDTPSTYL